MSSQLQGKPSPTSPYASIPGYRTNEPMNSPWNRQITAYHSANVPYTIESYGPPPSRPPSSSSSKVSSLPLSRAPLGPMNMRSSGSTNPALESAILEGFGANPAAYGGKNSETYLSNLFGQGVLTDADFNTLNGIVANYNAKVSSQNAKAQADYQQSLKDSANQLFSQAQSKGATSVHIYDQSGKILDTIPTKDIPNILPLALQTFGNQKVSIGFTSTINNPTLDTTTLKNQVNQTISSAKASGAQFINIFDNNNKIIDTIPIKDADQVLLSAATVQLKQGKQISIGYTASNQGSPFTGPTLGSNPKALAAFQDPLSELIRGSNIGVKNTIAEFQGLGQFILSGAKAPIPQEHEASLDIAGQLFSSIMPGGTPITPSSLKTIETTIQQNPLGVLGMALPSIETMIIPAGEIGAGAKSTSNIIKAVASRVPIKYAQSIPAYHFIKENFGTEFTQKIFASDLAAQNIPKLSKQISTINDYLGGMGKPEEIAVQTTPTEFLKGISTETISSLTKANEGLSAFQGALKGQVQQRQEAISAIENFANTNPGKVLATKTVPVIESITNIGPNTFGAIFNDEKSTFAGAIINMGKKGAGTVTFVSKATPELKTPSNFELMAGVRGVVRKGESQYSGLEGPTRSSKIQSDVASFLSGQNEEFEVTYPKNADESQAILGINNNFTPETEKFLKAFVPKPYTYAVGKEVTFASIRQMTKETPGLLPKELLGLAKPNLIESEKTGEIAFARTPIKNVVKNINNLKQPLKQFQELSGSRSVKYQKIERPSGFNYLASRFSSAGDIISSSKIAKAFKVQSYTKGEFTISETKGGAGGIGRANRLARETQTTKDQAIVKQIFQEKDLTKPLTKSEKQAIIRETGRRYAQQERNMIKEIPKNILNMSIKTSLAERKNKQTKSITETEFIRYPPNTLPPLLTTKETTSYKQKPSNLLNSEIKQRENLKMLNINKIINKEKISDKLINRTNQKIDISSILGRVTKTTQITTGIQTTKQIEKLTQPQKTRQNQKYVFPFGPPPKNNPPTTPPPGKKKPPFEFPGWLPNPTQGPGGPGAGEGSRKGFVGNVPEYEFTGMFNRPEIIYGSARTNPKLPKAQKGGNSERSFVFNSRDAKPSKAKSLSKRFNNLI